MNPSYYFPELKRIPDFVYGSKIPFLVPISICIGKAFLDSNIIAKFHSRLSEIVDISHMKGSYKPEGSDIGDLLKKINIQSLKNSSEKLFEEMMSDLAKVAYEKTVEHEPGNPSSRWIFGFPEVELGADIEKQMRESIKAATVNGLALFLGVSGGKGVKAAFTKDAFTRKAFFEGAAVEVGRSTTELATLDNNTNYFHVIAGSKIESEGYQAAFQMADKITDFVPIVGTVKTAMNLTHNVICIGTSYLEKHEIKKSEEKINKKIRENNKLIYEAIRSDIYRFRYDTKRFSEFIFEVREYNFAKKLVHPHPQFNNPQIYKNKVWFSDHIAVWYSKMYEDAEKLLRKVDQSRKDLENALQEKTNAEKALSDLEASAPWTDMYGHPATDIYDKEHQKLDSIRREKHNLYVAAYHDFKRIEEPAIEKVGYLNNIVKILEI